MILITMAGQSKRFYDAGYNVPKFMLPLGCATVFDASINSFTKYFSTEKFFFAIQNNNEIENFVQKSAVKLKINDFEVVKINKKTKGQAETAYLALKKLKDNNNLTIFNIDTIHHNYCKPEFESECDGYLDVFHGSGSHWSFVEPGENGCAIRTTEKVRISDLCSTGLYHFKNTDDFSEAFEDSLKNQITQMGEYYVAPLYNYLIKNKKNIKYREVSINQIDFCGTPQEYEFLRERLFCE